MKRLLIILTLAGLPCAPFAQTRLTLDACIEQAEANNKALAAADRQLAAAQFDFRSARANFFPSFSATGTGLYSTADGGLDIAGGALPRAGCRRDAHGRYGALPRPGTSPTRWVGSTAVA